MGTKHGKAGSVVVGSDTLQFVGEWTLSKSRPSSDKTNMGSGGVSEFMSGIRTDTGTVNAFADLDGTAQGNVLTAIDGGTSVTLNLYEDAGGDYFTGTAYCNSLDYTTTKDAVNSISFAFDYDGGATRTT